MKDLEPDAGLFMRLDLPGSRLLLQRVRNERRYFHSIEGWRIQAGGQEISDLRLSKLGFRGEDHFSMLDQHHEVAEAIFAFAETLAEPVVFDIWVSDQSFLPSNQGQP